MWQKINTGLRNLSRRHGAKVRVGVEFSVEECGLEAGEVVQFLDSIDKVNALVERGIV